MCALGVACVAEKVRIQRKVQGLDLAPTPLMDEHSPKLDQHEPSHSRTLHVIDDALLNMMDYMP